MKKYLLIDFDGVLNTKRHYAFLKKNGNDTNDEFGSLFDPKAVECLRLIVEQTGAEIVISSSWKEYGDDFLRELWEKRNLPGQIYSIIPSLLVTSYLNNDTGYSFTIPERYSKGLEINAWLELNAEGDYRYCIIDDETFFLPYQLKHLVQVDEEDGLTDEFASIIIERLNQE